MREEVAGGYGTRPPALEVRGLDVPFGRDPGMGQEGSGEAGEGMDPAGRPGEGGSWGLRDISFSVRGREMFALVGASGVGKTSLLQVISGFRRPSKGRVLVEGQEVTHRPPEERNVVFLTQRPVLFPHLSVFENVAFPLRVRKVPRDRISRRVEEALSSVRLQALSGRMPGGLSGGQAHRVALARAVVARPRVLLLDEPLTSLDPALKGEVRQAVLAIHREYDSALILVTHDLEEAGRLADRVGLLLDGGLEQVGPPREVFRHPRSVKVARFLGLPNQVPGKTSPGGILEVGGWPIPESDPASGGEEVSGGREEVVLVFGPDAGGVVMEGSGWIPGRVQEVHHHPQGATARVVMDRSGSWTSDGAKGEPEGEHLTVWEVRVDPICPPKPGSRVEVQLYLDRVHQFSGHLGK